MPNTAPATDQVTLIPCPQCGGFGYEINGSKQHVSCQHCHNDPALFARAAEAVLYWGKPISSTTIYRRKAEKFAHVAVSTAVLFFGIVGLGCLVYWAAVQLSQGAPLTDALFQRSPYLLLFWLSVLTDGYLYFRLIQQRSVQQTLQYQDTPPQALDLHGRPTWDRLHQLKKHDCIDISRFFTEDAITSLHGAYRLAKQLDHHIVTPLHLLGSALQSGAISTIVARLGLRTDRLSKHIASAMVHEKLDSGSGIDFGVDATSILFYAYQEARQAKRVTVDVTEIFLSLLHHDKWTADIFYELEVDDQTARNVVEWIHIQRHLRQRYREWQRKSKHKPKGIMNRAMTSRPSPLLQALSQDYTAAAARGAFFPMIGRSAQMDQVLRILRQRTGNIMLVGPPGVGKTKLFEGLAELMASEDVPAELQDKRFVVLDPGSLVANADGVGAIEGRIKEVIGEIAQAGNIILGIEDIHHLINMRSTQGSEDVAGMLMNALSQGNLHVVATTTTAEYQQFVENRGPFIRRFQLVTMNEMDQNDAIQVLEAMSGSIEYTHKVFFSYAAIIQAVELSTKFIQDRYLPAKALDVIEEAAGLVEQNRGQHEVVTAEDIATVIAEKTNVKVTAITSDEREKLLNLESLLHQRMVGQEEAVKAVSSALRRAREGLRDPGRPIANFLFVGPTGVGKTEMAKTIAEVYFGDENSMLRFDMSEFRGSDGAAKLIGSSGQTGLLTEAIRQKPFALVLLDELEKAHPNVLNLFLQVLDDGRITDNTGRTFDLSNTMIVATSNAGVRELQNAVRAGLDNSAISSMMNQTILPQVFRPEFLNRFDHIVVFMPLTIQEVMEITGLQLVKVAERLQQLKGITLEVHPEAIIELAKAGYDPQYGARPLRRLLQDTVDDALSRLLLAQKIGRRDTVVLLPGGQMQIKKAVQL